MVFPPNDSVSRRPLPSAGSLGWVPPHRRYYGTLRLLLGLGGPLGCLRRPRPRRVPRSLRPAVHSTAVGLVRLGRLDRRRVPRTRGDLSGFWEIPVPACPAPRPRRDRTHLAYGGVPLLPSENPISSAPTTGLLSEFDRTAHMLAVYASRAGSPQHPARLATRPVAGLCRGGIGYPLDLVTRFRAFRSSHPPCPDFPDAPDSPTGAANAGARAGGR
jgi:hypothetical protein